MRLIDADALWYGLDLHVKRGGTLSYAWCVSAINDAPTVDAVSVVRCKDCKYLSFDDPNDLTWGYCDYWFDYHYENDFCSYGEKR